MKLFYLALLLISTAICKAQDSLLYQIFPVTEKKVVYEKVIEAPGQSKDSLYLKAKMWALSAFNSQKAAFQTEDKEGGLLAYNTFFSNVFVAPPMLGIKTSNEWQYWSQVRLYVKDGKAKVVIENDKLTIINPSDRRFDHSYSLWTFKEEIDEAYKKAMAGKNYRQKYWDNALENFKVADIKYKSLVASLEDVLVSKKKSEADF
jgi:hypothetical protein